ncbi:MAG TPA: DUF4214 domain-containing protein [Ramlibacter sp.]|nr:DUF4214 domain-containing protein [Ramlibacter sp.]
MAVTASQLNELYLAYFGRPVDFTGYIYFTSNPNETVQTVAAAFAASDESQALYGGGSVQAQVNAIYLNLFNRPAELDGLVYWTTQIVTGVVSAAQAAIVIMEAAVGTDADSVANKLEASQAFFDAYTADPDLILGYSGLEANATARAFLATVDETAASLTAAIAGVDEAVADSVEVGGTIGDAFTLTTTVDTITISDSTTINTITGVVDGTTPANSTLSIGDAIDGNGKTILNIAVAADGTAAFASVKDVAEVNFTAGASGTLDINAVSWTGIGSVNLLNGVDGLTVNVDQLNAGADLSVGTGVSGTVSATYTNDVYAWLYSDRGSSIAYVDGAVTGVAADDGFSEMYLSATGNSVAITVGDVSITNASSKGSDAFFAVYNSEDKGGNITIGNVAMTGFDSNISFTASNTDHTASATAVNNSVGNVTLTGAGAASVDLWVYNTGDGAVGSTTVGNVAMSTGKSGDLDLGIYSYNGTTVGTTTVGTVALTGGVNASISATISATASAATTKAATVGAVTVGDITVSNGMSGTSYFYVSADAFTSGTGKASVGNVAIGNSTVTVAQAGYHSSTFSVSANSTGGGEVAVGNVTIGSLTATIAVDGYFTHSNTIEASTTGTTATVGNVTRGDVSLNTGINATAYYYDYIWATGTTASKVSVGDVTQGNTTLVGDDGAYVSYSYSMSSDGKIGNVAVGDITVALGVSATGYYDAEIEANGGAIGTITVGDVDATVGQAGYFWGSFEASAESATTLGNIGNVTLGNVDLTAGVNATAGFSFTISASNDLGNVTIGNIALDASAKGGYVYLSHDFSAWSADVGTVSVGNISAIAGASATASYSFYMEGETSIGAVTFGTVDFTASGASASAGVSIDISNDSDGTIGAVTVGDVTGAVSGAGAYGNFYVSVSSADSAGTVTVGDLDLTVGNVATKTGAYLEIDIGNDIGAVVVGDINLNATGVRGTTDVTMAYDADVSIWADTTVTVGNITVSGGGSAAEDFQVLTNWLTLTGGTSETIGGVDYSGFNEASTIDVSGFKGAATVVGSSKADTITDNTGVNAVTGGSGADTFVFVDGNTGKTEATYDSITDFGNAAGDKIDLNLTGGALDVPRYGEATYATFADFVTGSNAGNKAVFVGQIGANSVAAVDLNEDGTVDFMIQLTGVSLSAVDVASFI